MIIMPDAHLENTIAALMTSFYGNTGQRCLSGANAVVVGDDDMFYKGFIEAFVDAASRIRIGYGLDEAIQMGPMLSKKAKERVLSYIEKGIKEGAKMLLDGREVKISGDYPETCFLAPTVLEDVTPDMTIAKSS